jgi:hypothetical protein
MARAFERVNCQPKPLTPLPQGSYHLASLEMSSAAAHHLGSKRRMPLHRPKVASPIGFFQKFVGVFERVFGADNRSLPTLRRFHSRGSPETSQPKILCIWVKVDYAAESKSPYENYFDPSSSFNFCVAVSVRCRSASSARNLYHFRKRSVPKPQYAQFLSRNSSVSFRFDR